MLGQQRLSAAYRLAELGESRAPAKPIDPAMLPVLDDFVRDFEVKWLDPGKMSVARIRAMLNL